MAQPPTVGLVLSGAGARGAFEAGALSVLLPELERRGQRPTVLVGTSAGAINATILASRADVDAQAAVEELLTMWRGIHTDSVIKPPATAIRNVPPYVGQLLGIRGAHVRSLLDATPLRDTLNAAIGRWDRIRDNVERGALVALGVVATAAASNRTVVFVEGGRAGRPPLRGTLPPSNRIKAIDYVAAHIGVDHVLASSAIPFVFPPVRVAEPDAPGRWFIDGGTRLNTPLKPALSLGVDRVVIVASDSAERGLLDPVTADEPPDMGAALLHLIQTAVSDRLIEDVWRLAEINELVHTGSAKRVYPYRFVGPRADGELGHLAAEVLERKYRGPFSFFSDYSLLRRLLGGRSPQHAELISYMFFDPDFIEASIELGQLRARERMNERWRKGPLMTG